MHWLAQCHAKWPWRYRAFQHSSGIEPKSSDSLRPVLTTKPLIRIKSRKNLVHESSYFANCNQFFRLQDYRTQATSANSKTPCVCARLSDPHKQSQRAVQRAWQLILPSKPSIAFWNSLWKDCQMTCRGSNLDSNLNSAAWPTSCKGFIAYEITA